MIFFLVLLVLPSSYTLPQGSRNQQLQGNNSNCVTIGESPNVGTQCVFPFLYKGKTYHECAYGNVTKSLADNKRWCSTRVHPNGTHVRGQGEWGFCSLGCLLPKGCVKEENIDYYGYDVDLTIVNRLEECISWCGETAECAYWSFVKSDGWCYLKTSDSGRKGNSDRISGTKNCATAIPETQRSCPSQNTCETKDNCPYIKSKYEEILQSTPEKKSELVKFLQSIICNKERKAFCCPVSGSPVLTTFTVDTSIQFRYARTSVLLEAVNPSHVPRLFPFSLTLPETAFIMNMSLIYDGVEHLARVEEKEEAQHQFGLAVDRGETAAQVKKSERDAQKVTVDVNIEPFQTVALMISYEELLERKVGRYKYSANINPGSIVDNYTVNIYIEESLPIKDLRTFDLFENTQNESIANEYYYAYNYDIGDEYEIFDDPPDHLSEVRFASIIDKNTATIVYNPSREQQEREGRDGITGQINVEYDVERNNEDNIVQVLDGYFVHFFAPENEDILPKHVIFVLDTSGSMEGRKMEQLKNAMVTILEELTDQDFITIITFSGDIRVWPSGSQKATAVRDDASRFIIQLEAEGGTNINGALLTSINVADNLKYQEENVTPIIFFLTDGEATAGETSRETILENVKNRNQLAGVPIFTLAFGAAADFILLKDISLKNFGFSKKIYEGADAALQLEGFYQTISKPLLKNVKFDYVGDIWEKNIISESATIPTVFKGEENIAVGKLNPEHNSASANQIIIGGEGSNGGKKYNKSLRFTDISNISSSSDINFIERLWAFKTIKRLIAAEPEDPRKEATNLSLMYNFVTDLTSLIVTKPGEDHAKVKPVPIKESITQVQETNGGQDDDISYIVGDDFYSGDYTIDYEPVSDIFGSDSPRKELQEPTTARTLTTASIIPITDGSPWRIGEGLIDLRPDQSSRSTTRPRYTTRRITTTSTTKPSNCNITIFTKSYNRGDHKTFTEDQENLGSWDNKLVSLKVKGQCCWRLFTEVNYGGKSKEFCERAYNTPTDIGFIFKDASSLQIASDLHDVL